uniref:Uncharacterized protein n=1 Tax=Branchiostoma floridae TaxID=7739 RepID=C3ZB35_BRAFL|eukprot:XP_002594061.1 hypothetical protein BRAFLDRAFT_68499 [Branchiostoma floridae]
MGHVCPIGDPWVTSPGPRGSGVGQGLASRTWEWNVAGDCRLQTCHVSQSSVVLSFFERRPSDPPPPCQCSEDFARKHMSRKLQNGVGTPEENGGISCSTSADSSPKKPRSRTLKDIDGQEMTSSNEGSPTKAKFKTS